jgi:hypothetical protein
LNTTRLLPSDFQDLSSLKRVQVLATKKKEEERGVDSYFPMVYSGWEPLTSFPDRTQGFFYYHNPLRNIQTSGEVRFRITTSNDPSTFASGTDLLGLTSQPWRLPLMDIATAKQYNGLRQLLLEDDLVAAEVIQQCVRICDDWNVPDNSSQRRRFIHSFGQLFYVEFGSHGLTLFVVTNDSCPKVYIKRLFIDHGRAPFSGKSTEKI